MLGGADHVPAVSSMAGDATSFAAARILIAKETLAVSTFSAGEAEGGLRWVLETK